MVPTLWQEVISLQEAGYIKCLVMRMRIAQVAPYFYPHIGGVESHVLTISEGLVREGHEVVVYTSNYGDLKEHEISGDLEIIRVKQTAKIFSTPITPRIKKALAKGSHDVVHAHTPPPLSAYYAAKSCKKSKCPFVITYHCDLDLPGIMGKIATAMYHRTFSRYTFKHADRIIAHTKTYGATSRTIWEFDARVIPSAVNPERFKGDIDNQELQKLKALLFLMKS